MRVVGAALRKLDRGRVARDLTLILGLLVCFVGLLLLVQFGATLLVRGTVVADPAEKLKAQNDARSSILQALAGVALVLGLLYSARTFVLTRRLHRNDRLTRSIDQIGNSESAAVRAGGVYSLGLLAEEEGGYVAPVRDVLAGLVRERAASGAELGVDVQAAVSVLGRLADPVFRTPVPPVDLRRVELKGLFAVQANMRRVRLDGADLSDADFTDANFERASLRGARLDNANFSGACLRRADLTDASVNGTNFYAAVIDEWDTTGCDLSIAKNVPRGPWVR